MPRMLLIDDNLGDLTLMAEMLDEVMADFDIVTARGGGQGLSLLRKERVDIILVDHNMPGMDGTTFIHEARGHGVETPIILFTGSDDPALDDLARSLGASHVLVKPSSFRGFRDAAETIMAQLLAPRLA